MDRVGILVVSKCLSSAAIIDTFMRSQKYRPEFYVVEKQANPFNLERAKFHAVVPDLNLREVTRIARRFRDRVSFGLTDTEDFVTAGGRDAMEKDAGIQMLCVTRKYAVERSKAEQRQLFDRVFSGANPRYRIFDPAKYRDHSDALAQFRRTASELSEVVVKPDAPARGAGVGVWGKDFRSDKAMSAFFLNALSKGRVVVEEKVEGEESSFHSFSDGRHFVPAPLTRDYKRSLDGNKGKLTGGMGSYRNASRGLPFLPPAEWDRLVDAEEAAFRRWKGRGSDPGLRGIVLYDAIMHTGNGFKVLERNSRGGNTEVINILATMADDFVDVCHRILDGSLKGIRFTREASVVTCAVPSSYGVEPAVPAENQYVDLAPAYEFSRRHPDRLRVFPMDIRVEAGVSKMGTSRTVAVVGLGGSVEAARRRSLAGTNALSGPLRWRTDIASRRDITDSSAHLRTLRRVVATA
ncbi:MAG: hypothetical protein LYZ69_03805 [Nitrososphaerales archaeon]|nr:hypothetical protein [Nitrososphaerales archaeon]